MYISGDNGIATCAEYDDDTWDETFMEELVGGDNPPEEEQELSDMEDVDLLPPPLKIKTYKEVIESLEHVKNFLESHLCFTEAMDTSSLIDQVAKLHSVNARQSTLDDFFEVTNSVV